MADYTVLAEVGESLVQVLWQEIQHDQQVNGLIDNINRISLESPFESRQNNSVRLSIPFPDGTTLQTLAGASSKGAG
jgi:hypothetical protein